MIFITFLTAMALSGVAAYYSVIGLAAIFPGSFWPIIIMGTVLEAAKLVTVSWLYQNWKVVHIGMKSYLTVACIILMLITSMGIFGYLSKAHLEHSSDTAPMASKVQMLDEKIKVIKENIDANRKQLKQMDEAVDQIMGRSTDEKGADKANAVRRSQLRDRATLAKEIEANQKTISQLNEERFPIQIELQKAESDFGPIKYVAELIYGSGDKDIIDKAVRLVIMLIMVVFDPLAILLLIAANMSMQPQPRQQPDLILDEPLPEEFTVQKVADVIPESVKEPELEIPVFVPKQQTVNVEKDNLIVIDGMSGETIPAITEPTHEMIEVHHAPGVYEEHHVPIKTLEPKYDYNEPFAFKEKDNK
jgi:DNA-binding XRE family transcriptional regulator